MKLTLANRQRRVRLDMPWLRRFAKSALEACLEHSADEKYALKALDAVEVTVVTDKVIEQVHIDFMCVEGATDVITFEHGELVISADTAQRCATEHGHSVEAELGLYIVHGFLHLNGYDDLTPKERKAMHAVQNRIWQKLLDA